MDFSVKVTTRETKSDPPYGTTDSFPRADGMERPGAPNDTPGQGSMDPSASCQEHGHHHGGALLQDNRGRVKLEADARRSTGGKKTGSQDEDNKLGQSTNSQAECTQGNPSNSGLLTPGVQEVRQRLGSVRQMRGVPGKMEMGRWRMEIGWFFLQVAATAAITMDANGWFAGEPVAVPQCRKQPTIGTEFQRADSSPTKDEVKGTINDILGSRTWSADSRGPSRVRHGDGQRLRGRKRLTGNILKNVKVLEYEVNVNNNLPNAKEIRNKVDIFEIFSGTAKPTEMAGKFGFKALQPMDKDDGYEAMTWGATRPGSWWSKDNVSFNRCSCSLVFRVGFGTSSMRMPTTTIAWTSSTTFVMKKGPFWSGQWVDASNRWDMEISIYLKTQFEVDFGKNLQFNNYKTTQTTRLSFWMLEPLVLQIVKGIPSSKPLRSTPTAMRLPRSWIAGSAQRRRNYANP